MATPEQTRLALVLNGGVSLAVWMGGVTHELDLLRRASRGLQSDRPESVSPADHACFDMWQQVMRQAHTQVLVDVIAGTSAGGLNGSLLAAAIGRGTVLPDLRKTWQEAAALTDDRLLGHPPYNSVLDGRYFEDEIGKILHGMGGSQREAEPVTLFVTATALDGLPEYLRDGFGGRFQVADHRRIYKFQHDPCAVVFRKAGAESDVWRPENHARGDFLNEKVLDRLRLAARASAGFPVAFAPVDESPLLEQRVRPAPEIPSQGRDRASWIVDGGLLNNAPFEPVLGAIGDRRVDGPVRRIVVYIVPSTGVAERHADTRPPCKATEWPSVLGTAVSYPREADFRNGTSELLDLMNRQSFDRHLELFVRQIEPLRDRDARKNPSGPTDDPEALLKQENERKAEVRDELRMLSESLFREYRKSRISGAVWKMRQLREEGRGVRSLVGIPQAEGIDDILHNGHQPSWVPETKRALEDPQWQPWVWGGSVAERLMWTLVGDIERRLRVSAAGQDSPQCAPDEDVADARRREQSALTEALDGLSSCVRTVRAVQDTLFGLIRNAAETGGAPADRLDPEQGPVALLNAVYEQLGLKDVLGDQVHNAVNAYADALRKVKDPVLSELEAVEILRFCLIAEVVAHAFASPEELVEHTPQFEFLRLGPDDHSPVFPLDKYAPLGDRKLYGIRLGHFGAFVKPEWRASDFTWGRLDASHHLLRLFIPDHQERRLIETSLHEAILRAEIGKEQMTRNLDELAEPDDSLLFKRYLDTKDGRHTAGRMVEAVLSILAGKGSTDSGVKAEAGKVMFWRAFGRRIGARQWMGPSRLVCSPARWLWWWRIRRDPATAMRTTLLTALLALVSAMAGAFGLSVLVRYLWKSDWSWTLQLVTAAAGMAVLLSLEFIGTGLWCWAARHVSQRKASSSNHRATSASGPGEGPVATA
ncbi:patatin-like protein [Streptomyces sp. NPDC021622]|uniref:patatin-like protein n=1 Tax=Streptomyces sp. NPDC021622 TaxID=3155013 RepID=UPI0033EBEEAE